ncbi:MAG: DUF2842 domain-containing protein [Pseudomonadota bacterium]
MTYRNRKRLALLILVVGLPIYGFLAVTIVTLFDRPPVAVELAIYVTLGIAWALPFRSIFRGIGQEPPPEEGGGQVAPATTQTPPEAQSK